MTASRRSGKNKRLVIVGAGPFAEVACECFESDSPYEVVAFAVERPFITTDMLLGRPVVALEGLEHGFPPGEHDVYVAVVYTQLNRLRTRLLNAVKCAGYTPATYISTDASVSRNVELGCHCFIADPAVVHPFANIGDNVILWSGSHVGHHTRIGDNVFIAIHGVVAGLSTIGNNVFIGANACVVDGVAVAANCWISAGATVVKDTDEGMFYRGSKSEPGSVSALRFFGLQD